MIDLHTHTTYSDGRDNLVTLLKKAEEINLEYLSITDHNSCRAYEELKDISVSDYYKGKIVKGCEFCTIMLGKPIELLGYNIDTDFLNKELSQFYKYSFDDVNTFEAEKLLEICENLGATINKDVIENDKSDNCGRRLIFKELMRHEENKKFFDESVWGNSSAFYRNCVCEPTNIFFVDKSEVLPTPKEVIELIKKAGGLVFIPHIFVYGDLSLRILEELTSKCEIDGIECYYSGFTDEQTEYILNYSKKHNYYISGGSDYHASLKPGCELGTGYGNLNISYNVVKDWIKV